MRFGGTVSPMIPRCALAAAVTVVGLVAMSSPAEAVPGHGQSEDLAHYQQTVLIKQLSDQPYRQVVGVPTVGFLVWKERQQHRQHSTR
jgi:hypothetical protein